MTTYYLRFPDEPTGMAALDAAGLLYTDEDGNTLPITASHAHALDVIGPIYVGGEPPVLLQGWHCNYVGNLPEGWGNCIVTPEQPVRVFA